MQFIKNSKKLPEIAMEFNDNYFMKMALREAEEAALKGEVPVGAVVVFQDRVIARAHNLTQTLHDVTAHAEMQAITAAADYLGSKYLQECTLYVTLEPCVMCAGGMAWAQLGTLVYGAKDPKKGFTNLSENILHPKTTVRHDVLQEEATQILKIFFEERRNKKTNL